MSKTATFVTAIATLVVGVAVGAVLTGFNRSPQVVDVVGGLIETDIQNLVNRVTFEDGAFVKRSLVRSGVSQITTTGATYTLTENDMRASVIDIPPSTYGAALTLTLPATTTFAAILPNDGDTATWIIDNRHTAAGTTTSVVGYDIDGDTANDDVINGGVSGKLTCWNVKDATSFAFRCYVNEGIDAY